MDIYDYVESCTKSYFIDQTFVIENAKKKLLFSFIKHDFNYDMYPKIKIKNKLNSNVAIQQIYLCHNKKYEWLHFFVRSFHNSYIHKQLKGILSLNNYNTLCNILYIFKKQKTEFLEKLLLFLLLNEKQIKEYIILLYDDALNGVYRDIDISSIFPSVYKHLDVFL